MVNQSADGPCERAATALVLAFVLDESDVRARSRVAARQARAGLAAARVRDEVELAGTLADADTVRICRGEVRPDDEARAVLAAAGVPGHIAAHALTAATAVGRMRALVSALDGPERAAALERRLRAPDRTRWAREASAEEVVQAAGAAALARVAAALLEKRLEGHAETVTAYAEILRAAAFGGLEPAAAAEGGAAEVAAAAGREVARLLAAASQDRRARADRLVEALLARAKPEVAPVLPAPPEPERLTWLRGLLGESLYTDRDARDGADWLGSDPFRLRELRPAPAVLADVDTTRLPAERVVPVLRSLDLTGSADARATPDVSRCEVTGRRIPRVLHAVWLGGVPAADSAFLANLGYVARRDAGEVDVVLWTDRTREQASNPGDGPTRHLVDWAREHGVVLVDLFEVFHAGAPMITHPQYVLEMAKRLPRGYAAASDLVRLEVVHRFGGVYADGDLQYADQDRDREAPGPRPENLVEFLDRIAASDLGFTMDPLPAGGIGNDIVAGPAGHRAVRLWLEETRINYFRSHAQIFGGLSTMALPYVGEDRGPLRYMAPNRTGRMHHRVLGRLGLTGPDLPATQPPFRFNSTGTWIPNADDAPSAQIAPAGPAPAEAGSDAALEALGRALTVLEWQSVAREGDLYLASIDPVVRATPDPEAAWIALLTVFATLPGRAEITSVTDVRRRDDGVVERVELPREAQALIDRHVFRPPGGREPADWLGAGLAGRGGAAWLVDERIEAARLRGGEERTPSTLETFAPMTDVAFDLLGRPLGLWIRSAEDAAAGLWRGPERFRSLPQGWFGVSAGGPPGWDWYDRWPLEAEVLAELLIGAGAAGRRVLLAAPWDRSPAVTRLADRLRSLWGRDVEVVEGVLRDPAGPPGRPRVTALRYTPWNSLQSG